MIICVYRYSLLKDWRGGMNNGWRRVRPKKFEKEFFIFLLKKREKAKGNLKEKKNDMGTNLRWLAPSTILRWWRRDGIRRNCGGELFWDSCWPLNDVGAAAPLSFRNLLPMLLRLFWLPLVLVPATVEVDADVSSGPDIWTRRKKAKCCEQHLYSDLQALFDGVSKPNVLSSFYYKKPNKNEEKLNNNNKKIFSKICKQHEQKKKNVITMISRNERQ